MAPGACREPSSTGITCVPATIINYHPVSPRKSWHRCAALCLGESLALARLKCLDLHCSFEALMKAEYGGCDHLDFAARNYVENVKKRRNQGSAELLMKGPSGTWWWPCMGTTWTCSDVTPLRPVTKLYLRTTAWKWPPNWVVTTGLSGGVNLGRSCQTGFPPRRFWPGIVRLDYVDAFTLLGDAMHPAYGHPKTLA